MKKAITILAAILTLFAVVPYAMGATKMFQVNTLSGGSLTTGLVSYWNMQGNSNDYYGSNNGSDTGVSYSTSYGKVNQGVSFGSTDGNQILLSTLTGNGTGALSLNLWVYVTSFATTPTLFSVGGQSSHKETQIAIYDTSGHLLLNYWGDQISHIVTSNALSLNTWYMITATLTGSGNTATLYVNGVSWGTSTPSYNISGSNASAIGALPPYTSSGGYFYADEVGVWNKALSSQEITDLYNGGAGQTMCNGTGGPVCSTAKHKVLLISFNFNALPKNRISVTAWTT